MKLNDVLKPHFLSDEEMALKDKQLSTGEEEQLIKEMLSLIEENKKVEEELLPQENGFNC
ncbi:MAG: hypothetical protein PHS06_04300 [Candidatus Shapirobacteria bacterium]|nr:hypothetical protein [Candidatus Shapirobacteria bacterium]